MPLYEYQCETCEHRFEKIQKFSDPPPDACPKCAGPVRKLFSSPAIQFKGTGWYITDYAKKSSDGGQSGSSDKKEGEKGGDSKSEKGDSSGSAKTDSGSTKADSGSKSDSASPSSSSAAPASTPKSKD